jgi:hypothetical protein
VAVADLTWRTPSVSSAPDPSPMRLLERLADRFGLFEALAESTIKLNRYAEGDELAMDPLVAEAVLEFADDLRSARTAANAWARTRGLITPPRDEALAA